MRSLAIALLSFFCAAACGENDTAVPTVGTVSAFVIGPESFENDPERFSSVRPEIRVEGVVTATTLGPVTGPGGVSTALSFDLLDDEREAWTFGLVAKRHGEDSGDVLPEVDLEAGDRVSVELVEENGFAYYKALIVRDDEGLVLATDDGALLRDFSEWSVAVSQGDEFARERWNCGVWRYHRAVFEPRSGTPVEVEPFSTASVEVEGAQMLALAADARTLIPAGACMDVFDTFAWALLRVR